MGNYTLQQAQNDIANLRGTIAHLLANVTLGNVTVDGGVTLGSGASVVTGDSWHTLGTAGSTGMTLQQARYRLDALGDLEIDIALSGGPSVSGTYTWSNTLPAAYTPPGGNFLRIYPLMYNSTFTGGGQLPIVAIDCAGSSNPGRVRMTIPGSLTTNMTCTAHVPLN